jgi:hypothetical protein
LLKELEKETAFFLNLSPSSDLFSDTMRVRSLALRLKTLVYQIGVRSQALNAEWKVDEDHLTIGLGLLKKRVRTQTGRSMKRDRVVKQLRVCDLWNLRGLRMIKRRRSNRLRQKFGFVTIKSI